MPHGITIFLSVVGFFFVLIFFAQILYDISEFLENSKIPRILVSPIVFVIRFLLLFSLPLLCLPLLFLNKFFRDDQNSILPSLFSSSGNPPSSTLSSNGSQSSLRRPSLVLRLFLFALVVVALCASHYYAYNSGSAYAVESLAEESVLYARRQFTAGYNKGYLDCRVGSDFTSGGGNSGASSSGSSGGTRSEFYDEFYDYIDNMVWVTTYGTHYHKEDCFQLSGHDCEPCLLEDAKSRGYSPCSSCYD